MDDDTGLSHRCYSIAKATELGI